MRFLTALLAWLVTTALLAVTVPGVWAQRSLVDVDGYARLARQAADDPKLQRAAAAELTTQTTRLIRDRGYTVDVEDVQRIAAGYAAGPDFPDAFAQVNRAAHDWLFTDAQAGADSWTVDLAPMLRDGAFQQTLAGNDVQLPDTVVVPLSASTPDYLRAGRLRPAAVWGPWASIAAVALTVLAALLTLALARSRCRTLAGLGISALLVGAAGWAGIEVGRRYLDGALGAVSDDVRRIVEAMVDVAESGLHHWLNLTLAGGGVLVALAAAVALLGALIDR